MQDNQGNLELRPHACPLFAPDRSMAVAGSSDHWSDLFKSLPDIAIPLGSAACEDYANGLDRTDLGSAGLRFREKKFRGKRQTGGLCDERSVAISQRPQAAHNPAHSAFS